MQWQACKDDKRKGKGKGLWRDQATAEGHSVSSSSLRCNDWVTWVVVRSYVVIPEETESPSCSLC